MLRLAVILLFLSASIRAQEADTTIVELREMISKIVDVQTLESGERLDWEARKAEMAALLDGELEKSGQSAPQHSELTDELKAEIKRLKAARKITAEIVARNVPRTLSLAKQFPVPLLTKTEPELSSLRSWKATDEPREALRSILSLVAKAEQFNRRFTRTTEIRDNREVQVLYLGLAQAFYADRNEKAGIGRPGPAGWIWKPLPEIRPELVITFETLDKKRPPTMVTLPLEIR
jgi:hypothetical protein